MLLALLVACGGEVTIQPGQEGCTDYDSEDPEESIMIVTDADGGAQVRRTYVLVTGADTVFDPDIVVDDDVVTVNEAWTPGEGDLEFCWDAYIDVSGVSRKLQVQWFTEASADVPFDSVNLEP